MKIQELDLEKINAHTRDIWGCIVGSPQSLSADFVNWIPSLAAKLEKDDISHDVSVVFVSGCSTSNGHAFLEDGHGIAWISVSNYPTKKTIEVFMTHEIIHAIHYQQVPEYCFNTRSEKNHVGRQVVTEGVATYITQVLLGIDSGQSLWADYLNETDVGLLMERYDDAVSQTAGNILRDWDRDDTEYFYSSNPSNVDSYRSGYYIGRLAVERVVAKYGYALSQLLTLERGLLDIQVKEEIERLI